MWKKVFNRLLNQKSKHNYKPSILGILGIFVGQIYLDFFCQYKTSILTCIFKYTENKVHFCEVHKN